jgi:hypothetical protein
MRNLGPIAAAALTSCLLVPLTAHAGEVIFGVGPTTTVRTDGGLVAGTTFTSFGAHTFNSLGFIDVGSDGIAGSYTVGIWDSSQNLLAQTTVTPSSPLINGFRYGSIPATTIPNGQQFTIGALIPVNPADPWLEVQFVVLGAGFGGSGAGQFASSLVLTYPSTLTGQPYAVVNASDAVVPEPASLGLVGAIAMSLGLRRRVR